MEGKEVENAPVEGLTKKDTTQTTTRKEIQKE